MNLEEKFIQEHEPIISKELFQKAHDAFKKDGKPKYEDKKFIFGGFINCEECGCQIVAEMKKGKYIYYHCTWGKGNCNNKQYVKEEELEKQFIEIVKKISLDEDQKQWIITGLKQGLEEETAYHQERVKSLSTQALKLRERIKKIYVDKLDGLIDESFWLEQYNK